MFSFRKLGLVVLVAMFLVFALGCGETDIDEEDFLEDEVDAPPTAEGDVTWATIAGFYTDWAQELANEFTEETGIEVNIVQIDFGTLYEQQGIEMASATGAYDLVTTESLWLPEWVHAGFIESLEDYIDEAEMRDDIAEFDPGTFGLSSMVDGEIYALPYYTYTSGMFYREDLFENEEEKAAFLDSYGYELSVPTTWEEHRDIAEFFTRSAGETLKGEVLEDDFYGVGLMAGRFPHIQDEFMAILWGNGGDVVDSDWNVVVNSEIGVEALELYVELLQYAPPGALTSAFDEVVSQFQENMIAMTAGFYLDQWPNAVLTEDTVPGAVMASAEAPEKRGYVGAFGIAMTKDSDNKDEAFKFLSWLMSKESQMAFAQGGGTPIRVDVLSDPQFHTDEMRNLTGHYGTLLEVMESHEGVTYELFDLPVAGQVYEEMMVHCSIAATGEMEPREALDSMAANIDQLLERYR